MSFPLMLSLSAADTGALLGELAEAMPADSRPESCTVDDRPASPEDWRAAVGKARRYADAIWPESEGGAWIAHTVGQTVKAHLAGIASEQRALELLAPLPFEIACMQSFDDVWGSQYGYRPPRFDGGHDPHGWACAFRGAGHERLVSRRWLPNGPWRVTTGDRDLSFVTFHSPEADPGAALEEARAAHARMGISDEGGYIQHLGILPEGLPGLYDADTKVQKVVVHGRDVPQREMLGACQIRLDRRADSEAPISNIAYVFLELALARAHLRELWLRELECWAVDDGQEQRLDGDEIPPRA